MANIFDTKFHATLWRTIDGRMADVMNAKIEFTDEGRMTANGSPLIGTVFMAAAIAATEEYVDELTTATHSWIITVPDGLAAAPYVRIRLEMDPLPGEEMMEVYFAEAAEAYRATTTIKATGEFGYNIL